MDEKPSECRKIQAQTSVQELGNSTTINKIKTKSMSVEDIQIQGTRSINDGENGNDLSTKRTSTSYQMLLELDLANDNEVGSRISQSDSSISISPLIPSPRFSMQCIWITPRNEAKILLYVNPKLWNLCNNNNNDDTVKNGRMINSVSDAESSELDIELGEILKETPPKTPTVFAWKRSRKERGSSVPHIDSYYGTNDIDHVGHASYFIPILTSQERIAIGWKSCYAQNHWKNLMYSITSVLPNISQEEPMGQDNGGPVQFLRNLFNPKWSIWRRILPSCVAGGNKIKLEVDDDWSETILLPMQLKSSSSRVQKEELQKYHHFATTPPPIMVPLLIGRDNIWFLGKKIPKDHQLLIRKRKNEQYEEMKVQTMSAIQKRRNDFRKFHTQAEPKLQKISPGN